MQDKYVGTEGLLRKELRKHVKRMHEEQGTRGDILMTACAGIACILLGAGGTLYAIEKTNRVERPEIRVEQVKSSPEAGFYIRRADPYERFNSSLKPKNPDAI